MDAEAAASLMTTAAAPGGLVVEDFTVKYGKFTAVDLVRLAVGPATVTALLGLNGAGKSSLLRGLMGLVPSQGAVTLSGTADDRGSHIRSRRGLALISEGRGFFPSLSVEHNIVAGSIAVREGRRPRRRVRSLPHFVLLDEICRESGVALVVVEHDVPSPADGGQPARARHRRAPGSGSAAGSGQVVSSPRGLPR